MREIILNNGYNVFIGYYDGLKRAAQARNMAAAKYHSQHTKLNNVTYHISELKEMGGVR